MNQLLQAQLKIVPEMPTLLQKRYKILMAILLAGEIGRRSLSELVHLTERETRKETDLLNQQGLIKIRSVGMEITQEGKDVLDTLKDVVHEWSGLIQLEQELQKSYNLSRVIIVPGDSEKNDLSKSLLGQEAAKQLDCLTQSKQIVAVTGGGTIASIGEFLSQYVKQKTLTYVAARGGIGEEVQLQANTIAASFATATNGSSRTLYLPDHLSEEAYSTMMKEPVIKEMLDLYDQTSVVIHGIGDALEMANRRNSTAEEIEAIKEAGAVGEAFGYYFNKDGKAVHRIRTVGIQLKQLESVQHLLAVAGGTSKATAIGSYLKHAPPQTVLITDEGAAKELARQNEDIKLGGKLDDFKISD
ncbi:MAG: sugar-binding domain-containing protein [Paenisporosarcina sp.]